MRRNSPDTVLVTYGTPGRRPFENLISNPMNDGWLRAPIPQGPALATALLGEPVLADFFAREQLAFVATDPNCGDSGNGVSSWRFCQCPAVTCTAPQLEQQRDVVRSLRGQPPELTSPVLVDGAVPVVTRAPDQLRCWVYSGDARALHRHAARLRDV